ncbi:reverse transcriptase domain-containing protein [Tanacetum coccineum]
MCVDGGSLEMKSRMIPATTPLLGFNSEISRPLGQISLRSSLGDEEHFTSALMNFMVVRSPSPYNGIIDRLGLKKIQVVPSTTHRMQKFLVDGGIVTLRNNTIIPVECRMVAEAPNRSQPRNQGSRKESGCVPRSIAKHRLNISEGCQSIRQKRRGQAPDRNKAIQEEVAKLHDGNWRMCVDFMDLNKSCPKDCYPLPEIDWKVKSLCGYPFKCFLDAYKGYHQIQMVEEDEEKTAFHISQGIFCYTKMPFGLKIARTTYQWLVDESFERRIGLNLEVCVDDLVIKGHMEQEILRDIEETFHNLRRINMKLNPKKCTFGAEEGAFLGHVVSMKGIKACPKKAEAVMKLQSPRTLKEAQSLNVKLAIERAFQSMKQCMVELPMVTAPRPKEELTMYLCVAREAVGAVLLAEKDSQQM